MTEPLPQSDAHSHSVGPLVCLGCGLLCDDLRATVHDGRITEVDHACSLGRQWLAEAGTPREEQPSVAGQGVDREAALQQAIELLLTARSPLILGLQSATNETVRAACDLAAELGAAVLGPSQPTSVLMRTGHVGATFGEVRQRADRVLLWGDLETTHPRVLERLLQGADPRPEILRMGVGRFVSSNGGQRYWPLDRDRTHETVTTLRTIIAGLPIDEEQVLSTTGQPASRWRELAELLVASRYGTLVVGPELLRHESRATVEAVYALAADLNLLTRFALLALPPGGNRLGAAEILVSRTGSSEAACLATGEPVPERGSAIESRLIQGQVDLAIVVGSGGPLELSQSAVDGLRRVPVILIDSEAGHLSLADGTTLTPQVALHTRPSGPAERGTVVRADGVYLPLRPVILDPRPSAAEMLNTITQQIGARRVPAATVSS
jgi:formylmethanofuran dehydrogenase subunit B